MESQKSIKIEKEQRKAKKKNCRQQLNIMDWKERQPFGPPIDKWPLNEVKLVEAVSFDEDANRTW